MAFAGYGPVHQTFGMSFLQALCKIDRILIDELGPWYWGTTDDKKAAEVVITPDSLKCSRPNSGGTNPTVLTTTPLSKQNNSIRFRIPKLGNWVGVGKDESSKKILTPTIGIADSSVQITGGNTIGTQDKGVNAAYFWQSGINQLQMYGETTIKGVIEIFAGDFVDLKVDFDHNIIYVLNNERFVGFIKPTKLTLEEGKYFFCANLSVGTEVLIDNSV